MVVVRERREKFGLLLAAVLVLLTGCFATNYRPAATFTAFPTSGEAPLQVRFDASGSRNAEGAMVSYEWSFDHGKTATGKTTQYTFNMPGTYTVTLNVTGASGKTSSATQTITVMPQGSAPPAPPSSLGGYSAKESQANETSHAHTMSSYPKGEEAVTLAVAGWHMIALPGELCSSCEPWGPGGGGDLVCALSDDLDPCYIFHYDPTVGGYVMAPPAGNIPYHVGMGFWVRTEADNVTIDAEVEVPTEAVEIPLANGWNQIGNPVNFAVAASDLRVHCGDTYLSLLDAQAQGWISAYIFGYDTGSGGYVMINPTSGSLSPWTGYWIRAYQDCALVFSPSNHPPTASFTASPTSGQAPLDVSFDASGSSDSDGSIVSYTWSFGDGGSGSGVTTTHTYTSAGTYTARLTVTDDDGATDTITHSVTVTPNPSQINVVITASESEIDILDYEIEEHAWWDELVGHAKNITDGTINDVFIKARFLDINGVQLNTTSDWISDVLPNGTFVFSFYIWDPEDVKTVEIYEIETFNW